ncbi:cobalamin-dependent protein [Bacillus marasmi]|uniref:cobalamin-dependent protein n=1 Tax=Bacillus marasmi TaxID=1926279 RepID=UPI0011CBEEE1|nr:cobalamin-dependent protein [Bacillus marasmi]
MSNHSFLEKQKKRLEKQLSVLWSQINYCEDIETSSEALGDYLLKIKKIYLDYTGNENYITLIAERTKQKIDNQLTLFLDGLNKMIQLRENYTEINAKIVELNNNHTEVERELQKTFRLLKDVSSQTNILAINANIEAHRLGQQGAVFKIIATEVRKLSEVTSNSTTNITDTTSQLTMQTSEMTHTLNENNQTLFAVFEELEQGKESFITMYQDSENIVNESLILDDTLHMILELIEKVYVLVEYNKMSYANVRKILEQQVDLTKEMLVDFNKELGVTSYRMRSEITSNLYKDFYRHFKEENLEACTDLIKNALESGEDATFITNHILERTVETIGKEQIDKLVPLTEIYVNGRIIEACMDILIPILEKEHRNNHLGKIIIGNAFGDYHALGRKIIATFLKMAGFDVIDLGLSVDNDVFVKAAKEHNAKLICVSALILHTAEEVSRLRELLDKEGLNYVKILVGGAPFNFEPRLVQTVKADAMATTGIEAVKVAKELLGLLSRRVGLS